MPWSEMFPFPLIVWIAIGHAVLAAGTSVAGNFRGASRGFGVTLAIFGFLGTLSSAALLIASGFQVRWFTPLTMLIGSIVPAGLLSSFLLATFGRVGGTLCAFLWVPFNVIAWIYLIRA